MSLISDHIRNQLKKIHMQQVQPDRTQLNIEATAGMMAAKAVVITLQTETDWQNFFTRWRTIEGFARAAFPSPEFGQVARDGFTALFKHLMCQRGVSFVEDVVVIKALPPPRRKR